ncbi:hypothetical protein [Flavobacterium tructae]|uniref:Uncharacterized protein n=1 Tax=Flavobacterium tructae TaxID=1114873 RepID=A0A1S1J5I5_9FLAO|nr:hypothetical protein [Flavobacterium tructae]OHT44436.1 hypothetical protein BHE19_12000 [Flavobacterium tructae]OXB19428.1 hypothetical protein B0A71_12875 [Flavobacterium tructae]
MISLEEYEKALSIVTGFHEQIRLESIEVKELINRKTEETFRELKDVQPHDEVKCINVHGASSFTKDKKYEVLKVEWTQFQIMNDNGVKKWHRFSNKHFKLI